MCAHIGTNCKGMLMGKYTQWYKRCTTKQVYRQFTPLLCVITSRMNVHIHLSSRGDFLTVQKFMSAQAPGWTGRL